MQVVRVVFCQSERSVEIQASCGAGMYVPAIIFGRIVSELVSGLGTGL